MACGEVLECSRAACCLVLCLGSFIVPCFCIAMLLHRWVAVGCLRVSGGASVASPCPRVPCSGRCRLAVVGPAPRFGWCGHLLSGVPRPVWAPGLRVVLLGAVALRMGWPTWFPDPRSCLSVAV